MLTVHHLERAQSERIVWLCEELSIPYELKLYKRDPILAPQELLAISPLGAAPIIEDSTFDVSKPLRLAESAAITEYIVQKHGNGRFILPPSHKNYTDYLYWFHLSNGNLQPSVERSLFLKMAQIPEGSSIVQSLEWRLKRLFDHYNDRLKQVTWLAGEVFTAADIMTAFTFSTMRVWVPFNLSEYEGIVSWLQRVGDRPAYRKAIAKSDPDLTPVLHAEPPEESKSMKL